MAHEDNTREKSGNALMKWIDDRLPVTPLVEMSMTKYYAGWNFNFWYFMGSLAMLVLVNQILTGVGDVMATLKNNIFAQWVVFLPVAYLTTAVMAGIGQSMNQRYKKSQKSKKA